MPNKGTIPRVCETCGADFLAVAFQVKQGRARYCSTECYFRARYGAPHRITMGCENCRAEFLTWPSRLAAGKGKVCSKACSSAMRARRVVPKEPKVSEPRPPYEAPIEYFWARVDQSGGPDACWPWTGGRNEHGYGHVSFRPIKTKLAHRVAWILTHGEIPAGLNVCHHCDNPPCCNPAHLFLGTHADNGWDKVRKGRHHLQVDPTKAQGVRNPAARLSEDDVRTIRDLALHSDLTHRQIGERFSVSKTTIRDIVRGNHWSHVT